MSPTVPFLLGLITMESESNISCILCILHTEDVFTEEKIKPLTEENFIKLKTIVSDRQKFKSSKYRCVIKTFDILNHGYHYSCYKNFTAVPTTFRKFTFNSSTQESEISVPQKSDITSKDQSLITKKIPL